jgi:hypothetical protein
MGRLIVADPDRACEHLDFEGVIEVARLTANDDDSHVIAYSAAIRIVCVHCHEKFRWIGVPAGMFPDQPSVSIDEAELRAPIRPASSDPDFGLGIPGFAISVVTD